MKNMKQGQLTRVKYIVKKPFKYAGELLRRGHEWNPNGGRWDAKIIAQEDLVYRVEKPIVDEVQE